MEFREAMIDRFIYLFEAIKQLTPEMIFDKEDAIDNWRDMIHNVQSTLPLIQEVLPVLDSYSAMGASSLSNKHYYPLLGWVWNVFLRQNVPGGKEIGETIRNCLFEILSWSNLKAISLNLSGLIIMQAFLFYGG